MADIVERDIYEVANQLGGYVGPSTPEPLAKFLLREAEAANALADEITRLRSELANARNAVRPFAESDMRFAYETGHCESEDSCVAGVCDFTVGDLLRAAAALKAEGESR